MAAVEVNSATPPQLAGNPRLPTTGAFQMKRQQMLTSQFSQSSSGGESTASVPADRQVENETISHRSRSLPMAAAYADAVEHTRQRRPSVTSTTSKTSRFSLSSFRSRISRTFSQASVVEEAPLVGRSATISRRISRKVSRKELEVQLQQKEAEEEMVRAAKERATMDARALEEQLKAEERRASQAENALQTTADEVDQLRARLQHLAFTLEQEKAMREEAEDRIKEVERDIVDERAAAEKVYRMYVDLSCKIAERELEVPHIA
eukprot:comp9270_c0_seq1/m.4384 comp9270_c0_seq1/g.4384  ORF comp9270_c0_seq1/g.4384 comp9270_c0_seq1/m.4384 type:complete len:264 (-) comp9270_c0_seq1:219-1010(-)